MTTHFSYYSDWKTPILTCPQCGWTGTFEQGEVELYSELMDTSCPRCDTMLALVSYPTIKESEANVDKLTSEEKRELATRKKFMAEWEASSLKSPDELPDLEGPTITILWDQVGREGGHEPLYTVLRHGKREIWRERACWEGYERFDEVVKILQAKYGHRLLDVVPTQASTQYLYGDRLWTIEAVEDIRKSLSKLRLIRANLSSAWILAQQLEQDAREEASDRDRAYLAERERVQMTPDKPKTRKRKR
jgi:hypothetical protein